MGLKNRLFRKKDKKVSSDKKEQTKQIPNVPGAKQINAILVFSLRPLNTPEKLLKQIAGQQRSNGCTIAPNCVAKAGVAKDPNDKALIYAAAKKEFPNISAEELIKRTNVYPFKGSDGNNGKYCVVYDRG